jgi:hypothetical protein
MPDPMNFGNVKGNGVGVLPLAISVQVMGTNL